MERSEKGNQELQLKLDKYSDMLFKIAYMRLDNYQDAEDVVQETFFQYLKRKEAFESEEHEKAWLIKVTLNSCRKVWRSAWNRHRSDTDGEEDGEPYSDRIPQGLEEGVLAAEDGRRLLEAVQSLPPKYRDVIHLFYYEELSVKEIGAATGRRESTVTSQLTRGRELLKKRLKEGYGFA